MYTVDELKNISISVLSTLLLRHIYISKLRLLGVHEQSQIYVNLRINIRFFRLYRSIIKKTPNLLLLLFIHR